MTIESKFDVGDLANYKYSVNGYKSTVLFYEVLEVNAQKCYGGTQVFLNCRPIHAVYEGYGKDRRLADLVPGFSPTQQKEGWVRFREDELSLAPESVSKVQSPDVI
jgi:hypothetical protein